MPCTGPARIIRGETSGEALGSAPFPSPTTAPWPRHCRGPEAATPPGGTAVGDACAGGVVAGGAVAGTDVPLGPTTRTF